MSIKISSSQNISEKNKQKCKTHCSNKLTFHDDWGNYKIDGRQSKLCFSDTGRRFVEWMIARFHEIEKPKQSKQLHVERIEPNDSSVQLFILKDVIKKDSLRVEIEKLIREHDAVTDVELLNRLKRGLTSAEELSNLSGD